MTKKRKEKSVKGAWNSNRVSKRIGRSIFETKMDVTRPRGRVTRRKESNNFLEQFYPVRQLMVYYDVTRKYLKKVIKKIKYNIKAFISLLEMRLQNVVYKCGIAKSIFLAKQLISHKKILVNDKVLNIRSYTVKEGDVIKLVPDMRNNPHILDSLKMKNNIYTDITKIDNYTYGCKVTCQPSNSINFRNALDFLNYR